jgi:hypothetical protein
MKALADRLVKELRIDPKQATGGAALLFKAARDKLGDAEFTKMLGKVDGLDDLMRQAPQSGGLGRLFGGLASAVGGGDAAIIASIVSGFGRLGLTQEHARAFVPVMLDYLRGEVGRKNTDKLEKALRG